MRSGIMYGAAAMLDGMIERMEEELGKSTTVVATGGMAQFVAPLCKREMKVEKDLLLKGLNAIYKKNKNYTQRPPAQPAALFCFDSGAHGSSLTSGGSR